MSSETKQQVTLDEVQRLERTAKQLYDAWQRAYADARRASIQLHKQTSKQWNI